MVNPTYIPDKGDYIWMQFSPQLGREQAGHRPALVLTPRSYNERAELCIVLPISRQVKGYPFEIEVNEAGIQGAILSDHAKSMAWGKRDVTFIGKAGPRTLSAAVERLMLLLD